MTPSLLDLTDETLQRIAYFTNKDSELPIPSYGPHWQNFKSDIRAKSSKDLLAFRSTCRRIHEVCTLKNIHLYLYNITTLRKWLNKAPLKAENSISRLRLHLNSGDAEQTSMWATLATLLHSLPNVEELILNATPICRHYYRFSPSEIEDRPRLPKYPILPNLQSLSITVKCNICAIVLPMLILPAAKKLEHLKIRLVSLEELVKDDIDSYDDKEQYHPAERIRQFADLWCKDDEDRRSQLKSLYIKYPTILDDEIQPGWAKTITQVFQSFPMLQDLKVTQYHLNTQSLAPGITVIVCKKKANWRMHVKNKAEDGNENKNRSLANFLEELGPSKNLKYFDPIILVQLRSRAIVNPTARLDQTFRSFSKWRPLTKDIERDSRFYQEHRNNIEKAMIAVASLLLEYFPSLESGALWELGTDTSQDDWFRWNWTKQLDKNGISKPVIDKIPWHLTNEFVQSKDGVKIPHQGNENDNSSDDSQPESDDDSSDQNSVIEIDNDWISDD